MSRPFVLRDAEGRVIDALGSAPLTNALKRPGLGRVDIWPQGRRKCTVGFAWADGATAIGDLPWSSSMAIAWLEHNGQLNKIRHHVP